jgi:hypothetical protein
MEYGKVQGDNKSLKVTRSPVLQVGARERLVIGISSCQPLHQYTIPAGMGSEEVESGISPSHVLIKVGDYPTLA